MLTQVKVQNQYLGLVVGSVLMSVLESRSSSGQVYTKTKKPLNILHDLYCLRVVQDQGYRRSLLLYIFRLYMVHRKVKLYMKR